jgi:hypothetical protein
VPKGTVPSFSYDFRQPLVLQSSHLMVYQPDPNDRRNEKILTPFRNPLLTYNFPQSGGIPSDDWKALDKDDAEQDVSEDIATISQLLTSQVQVKCFEITHYEAPTSHW